MFGASFGGTTRAGHAGFDCRAFKLIWPWNGAGGILSSNAAAQPGFAVGYGDAADLGLVGQTFGGETVEANSVLFRLTRYGDANLDGQVNLGDFNRLAANFGASNSFWHRGDFNYDGNVNLSDFNLLAANFGLSAAGPEVTPQDWARLAKENDRPDADGIFLSCTNTRQIEAIADIEKTLGKPVVNSNQAVLWGAVKRLSAKVGAVKPMPQLGRLMANLNA